MENSRKHISQSSERASSVVCRCAGTIASQHDSQRSTDMWSFLSQRIAQMPHDAMRKEDKPDLVAVTAKTRCQHRHEFSAGVHAIPVSTVTASQLFSLNEKPQCSMWHALQTERLVGYLVFSGTFWRTPVNYLLFFYWYLEHCIHNSMWGFKSVRKIYNRCLFDSIYEET